MLWRGDTRRSYVRCAGDARAGDDVRAPFADTWREGDAPGDGADPSPGLYEPGRGFGAPQRENAAVRACLGYATGAAETASTLAAQPFRRATFDNLLVGVGAPEGRVVDAVYGTFLGSGACSTTPELCRPDYERYPAPAR
jgi:hypothetical protein